MDDFVSYNELVEQGITPRFELSISNNPVKRPLARNIGRALLPKRFENWFLGNQEDEDLLNRYNDNDIPTYDEINENYNSGLYNKEDLINYSNLRNQYDQARANRDYTDVRNANIGQGIVDIGSAAIGGGGATATKAGVKLLRPLLGKKIALQTTQGLLGGGLGGAAHGFGTGLVQEDVNPLTQGLIEGGIGLGIGGAIGLGLGQIGKRLAYNNLFKNDGIGLGRVLNGDETKFTNYFDDYVSGLKGDPEFITDFSQLPAVGERTLFDNANTNLRLARQGLRPRATTTEGQYLFAGENSTTADKQALETAKELFNNGVDNESIRQQTGWFQGVDGKWRYEIPDGHIKDIPIEDALKYFDWGQGDEYYAGLLPKIYDAPELYEAYPELKQTTFRLKELPENVYAQTDASMGIDVNKKHFPLTIDQLMNHENQHQIQMIENFAQGGNEASNNYLNLAGEAESRLVESRHNLTPEQRLTTPIKYDISPENQIVEFNNNGLYQKITNNDDVLDLTGVFNKDITPKQVKEYVESLVQEGAMQTKSPNYLIDVPNKSINKRHIQYKDNWEKMPKEAKRRHNALALKLKEMIKNSRHIGKPKPNTKPDIKPNVDKYHYFKVNVKVGDNEIIPIVLDTEQLLGESTTKPQTVHLYNFKENK